MANCAQVISEVFSLSKLEKNVHDLRIELGPAMPPDLLKSSVEAQVFFVGPSLRHGFERINDSHDPGPQRNLVPFQA